VPLHALGWSADDRPRCLLDQFEVSYAPSAYVRDVALQRAAGRGRFTTLLCVGNPLPQSKPLVHSEIEAELVAATMPADTTLLLTREAATKEAVMSALPKASHIHLACHGQAASDPLGFDAAVTFAHDVPVPAAEIIDLDLSQARLIVASACETGVVAGYDTLDEALALSTIFLAAGAAGTVASLWKVYDEATRLLMSRLYEEFVSSPDRPARALRAAQLWLRDLTANDEARYTRAHPQVFVDRDPSNRGPAVSHGGTRRFSDPIMWAAFALNGA
jgi:CHAT domain-containing protein